MDKSSYQLKKKRKKKWIRQAMFFVVKKFIGKRKNSLRWLTNERRKVRRPRSVRWYLFEVIKLQFANVLLFVSAELLRRRRDSNISPRYSEGRAGSRIFLQFKSFSVFKALALRKLSVRKFLVSTRINRTC